MTKFDSVYIFQAYYLLSDVSWAKSFCFTVKFLFILIFLTEFFWTKCKCFKVKVTQPNFGNLVLTVLILKKVYCMN